VQWSKKGEVSHWTDLIKYLDKREVSHALTLMPAALDQTLLQFSPELALSAADTASWILMIAIVFCR
jgi:hypothetical protein